MIRGARIGQLPETQRTKQPANPPLCLTPRQLKAVLSAPLSRPRCTAALARGLAQAYGILYAFSLDSIMTSITVTQARANLFKLLDQTAESHEPIQITGRRQNGVLLSEDDFRAMQETLYLLSVPGMKASLRKARKAPLKAYSKARPW